MFALGSPGGSNIISYVATTLIALIDWKMDMQAAVSLPHFVNRFGRYDLEQGTAAADLADDLAALGYQASVNEMNSGLNGIAIGADGLDAAPTKAAKAWRSGDEGEGRIRPSPGFRFDC